MKAFRLADLAVAAALVLSFGGLAAAQTVAAPRPASGAAPAAPVVAHAAVPLPPEKPKLAEHGLGENAGSKPAPTAVKPGTGAAHAYLFRGLMNIFSLGMDDLALKIEHSGVAASVYNHSEWQEVANEIAAKYKAGNHGPIILIGHSLGADAVMLMGEYLGSKGVPVALIVPFDATRSLAASSNVASVMNITQRDYAYMRRGYGFHGDLANIDVSKDESIGHISIDKTPRLHVLVVNKIAAVARRGGGTEIAAPTNAPAIPPSSKPAFGSANLNAPGPAAGASAKLSDSIAAHAAPSRAPVSAGAASNPSTSLEFQQLGR